MYNLLDTLRVKYFKKYYWYKLKKLTYWNNFLAKYFYGWWIVRYDHLTLMTEVYLYEWEHVDD